MVAILAVLVISGEYGTGMIRVTLAAMPRRTAVLAAKAATVTGVVLVAGALAVAGSVLAGRLILPGHGFPALGPDAPVLRAAAGSVLYLALIALLSLGIGTAVRDAAAAIGVVLGLLYLIPIIATTVTDPAWHRHLEQLAPMTAGLTIQDTTGLRGLPLSPWAGLGVLAAWAARRAAARRAAAPAARRITTDKDTRHEAPAYLPAGPGGQCQLRSWLAAGRPAGRIGPAQRGRRAAAAGPVGGPAAGRSDRRRRGCTAAVRDDHRDGVAGAACPAGRAAAGLRPVSAASLLAGSHTVQVWYAGPDHFRLALPQSMSEDDLVRNGTSTWLWDSARQHGDPSHAAGQRAGAAGPSRPADPAAGRPAGPGRGRAGHDGPGRSHRDRGRAGRLPAGARAAEQPLADRPGAHRHRQPPSRAAAGAGVRPRRGHARPPQVGFTAVSFGPPPAADYAFTPPAGATVTQQHIGAASQGGAGLSQPDRQPGPGDRHRLAGRGQPARVVAGQAALPGGPGGGGLLPFRYSSASAAPGSAAPGAASGAARPAAGIRCSARC